MEMRTCKVCGDEKPIERFGKISPNQWGGRYRRTCRKCEEANRSPEARAKAVERKRRELENLWLQTVEAYGGVCTCCGEAEPAFLVIDHVNDDGAEHRRQQRPGNPKSWSGKALYRWLRQQGWPAGFQLLCANCNMAKARKGGCPHGYNRSQRA